MSKKSFIFAFELDTAVIQWNRSRVLSMREDVMGGVSGDAYSALLTINPNLQ